jgi:hypothetical protein
MISSLLRRPVPLITLIVIWFSAEVLLLGKFAFTSTGDGGELFIPALIAATLNGWESSLWYPLSTLGTDRAALAFTNIIDRLLFGFLPGWLAYAVHWVAIAAAAVGGFYLLARRSLGVPHWAAAAGAFVFFYSQYPNHWVAAAVMLLPMMILATEYVLDNKRAVRAWVLFILAGLFYGCVVYLSRIQPFLFIILGLWFVFVRPRTSIIDWGVIFLASLLSVLPRLQEVMAAKNFALLSQRHNLYGQARMYEDLSDMLVRSFGATWNSVLAVIFFGIGLVLYALYRKDQGLVLIRLFAVIALVFVGVALLPVIKPVLIDHVELLRSFDLRRLVIYLWVFTALGGAVGAGLSWPHVETYLSKDHPGAAGRLAGVCAWRAPIILAGLLLLASLPQKYASAYDWISQGNYKFLFESPVLKSLADRVRREDPPYRAASFEMYPNYLHAYGIETIGGYQVFHTRRFAEFWGKVLRRHSGGPPQKGEQDIDRIFLNPVKQPGLASWPLDSLYRMPLFSLASVKYFVSRDPMTAFGWQAIHRAQRPWAGMSQKEKAISNLKGNFTGRTHLYLYENVHAFPRAFFVRRLARFTDGRLALDALAEAGLETLRTTGFVVQKDLPPQLESPISLSQGAARFAQYGADRIVIITELSGSGVLVIGQNYTPDWKCETKDKKLATFPIDHTFLGVSVSKEITSLTCRYTPSHRAGQ